MKTRPAHAIIIMMKTLAIILAGGQGQRLGGIDKGLLPYHNSTLIECVLAAIAPQVDHTIISCNRNVKQYQQTGYPTVQDRLAGYQGPLAGIAAALDSQPCETAITVPCDNPQPPDNLVSMLSAPLTDSDYDLCFAWDGDRDQYLFSAIQYRCLPTLTHYLQLGGRSVKGLHKLLRCQRVDFSAQPHRFANINSPEDL